MLPQTSDVCGNFLYSDECRLKGEIFGFLLLFQLFGGADGNEGSLVHDENAVAEFRGFLQIMGDEHDGEMQFPADI